MDEKELEMKQTSEESTKDATPESAPKPELILEQKREMPTLLLDTTEDEEELPPAKKEKPERKKKEKAVEEKPAAESAPEHKKGFKFPYFWVIYGLLIVVFGLFLKDGAGFLNRYLTAFEASQPIHCAEAVFEKYFSGEDMIDALTEAGFSDGSFETVEAASRKLMAQREGMTISFYAGATIDEELCYNVILTDPSAESAESEEMVTGGMVESGKQPKKIASMYLKKQSVADEFGNVGYEFSRLEVFVTAEESVKVTVPRGHKLSLNGKEVGEEYLVEETFHNYNDYVPETASKISYVTYFVDGLYLEPTLTLLDRFEREQTLDYDEEKDLFSAPIVYNDELEEQYGQRVLTGMQEFAKYMQDDGWSAEVRKYFDTTSELYRNIIENPYYFVLYHNSYSFQNVSIGEFYQYDENTFSCHVVFDHVLHRTGAEDYVDHIDNIVFLKKIGENFYIYNRIVQ